MSIKIFLTCALAILLGGQARAEGVSCWILCHRPPDIASANDVAAHLRMSSNQPLNGFARSVGILTTYLGKVFGVQGWKNYHLSAHVTGLVVQAVGSSDGLYTIDLSIQQLAVDGRPVKLPHPSFIRIEVFPFVRKGASLPVHAGQEVSVSGNLMWDGDGFLEIHPKHSSDIVTKNLPKRLIGEKLWLTTLRILSSCVI